MPKQTHIRKLAKKSKYSYIVTIPKEIIDEYGWKDGQKINIEQYGTGKILISDWKK